MSDKSTTGPKAKKRFKNKINKNLNSKLQNKNVEEPSNVELHKENIQIDKQPQTSVTSNIIFDNIDKPFSMLSMDTDFYKNDLIQLSDFRDIPSETTSPLPTTAITLQTPEILKHRQRLEFNMIEDDRPNWTQIPCVTAIIETINDNLEIDKRNHMLLQMERPSKNIEQYIRPIEETDDIFHFNEEYNSVTNNLTNQVQQSITSTTRLVDNEQEINTQLVFPHTEDTSTSSLSYNTYNTNTENHITPLSILDEDLHENQLSELITDDSVVFQTSSSELDTAEEWKPSFNKRVSRFLKYSNLNIKENFIELIESYIIQFQLKFQIKIRPSALLNQIVALFNKEKEIILTEEIVTSDQVIEITTTADIDKQSLLKQPISISSVHTLLIGIAVIISSILFSMVVFFTDKLLKVICWLVGCYISLLFLPLRLLTKLITTNNSET